MHQHHTKQSIQNSQTAPQSSFLDTLFQTHRVIRMSICASLSGMLILLALAYLLRDTHAVLHLCLLAVIMFILSVLLCIYKALIGDDVDQSYDRVHQCQQDRDRNRNQHQHIGQNDDDDSDDSSLVQVIPKKKSQDNKQKQKQKNKQKGDTRYADKQN